MKIMDSVLVLLKHVQSKLKSNLNNNECASTRSSIHLPAVIQAADILVFLVGSSCVIVKQPLPCLSEHGFKAVTGLMFF